MDVFLIGFLIVLTFLSFEIFHNVLRYDRTHLSKVLNNLNTIVFFLVIFYDIYSLSQIYFKYDKSFFNNIYVILSLNIAYIVIGIITVVTCKVITRAHRKIKSKLM